MSRFAAVLCGSLASSAFAFGVPGAPAEDEGECDAPFGHHEGTAVRLCQTPLSYCLAPPLVTMSKYGYPQAHWQHCNGSTLTAKSAEETGSGAGLQGQAEALRMIYPSVSSVVTDAEQVSAGHDYSLVLHSDGRISAFGSDSTGRMGIGARTNTVFPKGQPVLLPTLAKGLVVSAGTTHSLFVATDGTAYATGGNEHGQLCHPKSTTHTILPMKVPLPFGTVVVDASAGKEHSLFLTRDGKVYACGNNHLGRLGITADIQEILGDEDAVACAGARGSRRRSVAPLDPAKAHPEQDVTAPQAVLLDDVMAISAGMEHSLFVQRGGQAFAAGSNQHGALGVGAGFAYSGAPVKVPLPPVAAVSTAGETGDSAFLLQDGSVYTSGENEYYQGAVGKTGKNCNLTRVPIEDAVALTQGAYGTMFMTRDGGLYFTGPRELVHTLVEGLDEDGEHAAPVPWRLWGLDWYQKPKDFIRLGFSAFATPAGPPGTPQADTPQWQWKAFEDFVMNKNSIGLPSRGLLAGSSSSWPGATLLLLALPAVAAATAVAGWRARASRRGNGPAAGEEAIDHLLVAAPGTEA